MSVGSIPNLLNNFNKKYIVSKIVFYSMSSINLVMNLHKFNILFITYIPKRTLNCNVKKNIFYAVFV